MLKKEELLLIGYFAGVILVLTILLVLFFITYQRKKNKVLIEKFEAEKKFERELVQSQLEIQEQTLKNVGWELHDNIGQLLSVASMQLNILSRNIEEHSQPAVLELKGIVSNSLQEVRSLSKSLNNEVIDHAGLENSFKNELDRFERLKILQTTFSTEGEKFEIIATHSVIIFRIFQEFFSNVIKHAEASELHFSMIYSPEKLQISASDNGKGFEVENVEKNSGILNMQSRSKLIGADLKLESIVNKGTSLSLLYQHS